MLNKLSDLDTLKVEQVVSVATDSSVCNKIFKVRWAKKGQSHNGQKDEGFPNGSTQCAFLATLVALHFTPVSK